MSILAGVYHRWTLGNASGGDRARYTGKVANISIDFAWAFINQKSMLPDKPPTLVTGGRLKHFENESEVQQSGRFAPNQKVLQLQKILLKFMVDHIYPMKSKFSKLAQSNMRWTIHPEEENLKELAKKEGLWNLFIPLDSAIRARKLLSQGPTEDPTGGNNLILGAELTNLEYGFLCEIMGRSSWAPQVSNCGAPDTGNMEVLLRYGTKEQIQEWLIPLLEGKIRSGFAMTKPQVASSDATNIECSITRGYYRCSSSKGCSARKQVERSRTDPNMLVITYTSEHNHPWPTQRNALAGSVEVVKVLIQGAGVLYI